MAQASYEAVLDPEYLPLSRVARKLGVHPATVTRWILQGKLIAHKFPGSWRIRPADLDSFINSSRTASPEPAVAASRPRTPRGVPAHVQAELKSFGL